MVDLPEAIINRGIIVIVFKVGPVEFVRNQSLWDRCFLLIKTESHILPVQSFNSLFTLARVLQFLSVHGESFQSVFLLLGNALAEHIVESWMSCLVLIQGRDRFGYFH